MRPYLLAYDHRIFYVAKGKGSLLINGHNVLLRQGMLGYWMSGNPYRFIPQKGDSLKVIH